MEHLNQLFANENKMFTDEFQGVLQGSTSSLLREVGEYILESGGKRLRPNLVFLAGNIFSGKKEDLVKVATAIELIHNATLLHDDVIDHSERRRNRLTVQAKFGVDVAILVADFLFSQSFDMALSTLKPELMRSVAAVTSKMCEGELFQLGKKNSSISLGEYYEIIELKTALLFAASLSLGALVSGASPSQVRNLSEFGISLGKLFQVTDDILAYIGTEKNLKKDVGNDFLEGKQTMPLIFALMQANESQKRSMMELIESKDDFPSMMKYVEILGGIDSSISEAKRLAGSASEKLMDMPKNEYSDILAEIPHKVLSRII